MMMSEEIKMYQVQLINMGYSREFDSLDEAMTFMEHAGFESSLSHIGNGMIATFSPISGFRSR